MSTEIATPPAAEATASEQPAEAVAAQTPPEEAPPEPKEEKTERHPLEREVRRKDRRIDTLTRRLAEANMQLQGLANLQPRQSADRSGSQSDNDDEPVQLTRRELREQINAKARELAPSIAQESAERQRREDIVSKLTDDWGQAKFDALAKDLDTAFDGLQFANGRTKPSVDAIFESDDPRALIEYLADPDNSDEAESISRMSASQAGRAVARLEDKLKAERAAAKAKAKAEPSKASPPIEASRGGGAIENAPRDSDSMSDWVRKERARMKAAGKRV